MPQHSKGVSGGAIGACDGVPMHAYHKARVGWLSAASIGRWTIVILERDPFGFHKIMKTAGENDPSNAMSSRNA